MSKTTKTLAGPGITGLRHIDYHEMPTQAQFGVDFTFYACRSVTSWRWCVLLWEGEWWLGQAYIQKTLTLKAGSIRLHAKFLDLSSACGFFVQHCAGDGAHEPMAGMVVVEDATEPAETPVVAPRKARKARRLRPAPEAAPEPAESPTDVQTHIEPNFPPFMITDALGRTFTPDRIQDVGPTFLGVGIAAKSITSTSPIARFRPGQDGVVSINALPNEPSAPRHPRAVRDALRRVLRADTAAQQQALEHLASQAVEAPTTISVSTTGRVTEAQTVHKIGNVPMSVYESVELSIKNEVGNAVQPHTASRLKWRGEADSDGSVKIMVGLPGSSRPIAIAQIYQTPDGAYVIADRVKETVRVITRIMEL